MIFLLHLPGLLCHQTLLRKCQSVLSVRWKFAVPYVFEWWLLLAWTNTGLWLRSLDAYLPIHCGVEDKSQLTIDSQSTCLHVFLKYYYALQRKQLNQPSCRKVWDYLGRAELLTRLGSRRTKSSSLGLASSLTHLFTIVQKDEGV